MRLIDADEMNEDLFYEQLGGKDTLITAESAFNMIKAQPTAYDVERVVEELGKLLWMCYTDCGQGYSDYKKKMREIVRKGGIE